MAKLIRIGGTVEDVKPAIGKEFGWQEICKLIGCDLVQMIPLGGGRTAWMDEEGKLKPHTENKLATEFFGERLLPGDYFAGNVLICEDREVL